MQIKKENEFTFKLDNLFDVAIENALNVIKGENVDIATTKWSRGFFASNC